MYIHSPALANHDRSGPPGRVCMIALCLLGKVGVPALDWAYLSVIFAHLALV